MSMSPSPPLTCFFLLRFKIPVTQSFTSGNRLLLTLTFSLIASPNRSYPLFMFNNPIWNLTRVRSQQAWRVPMEKPRSSSHCLVLSHWTLLWITHGIPNRFDFKHLSLNWLDFDFVCLNYQINRRWSFPVILSIDFAGFMKMSMWHWVQWRRLQWRWVEEDHKDWQSLRT